MDHPAQSSRSGNRPTNGHTNPHRNPRKAHRIMRDYVGEIMFAVLVGLIAFAIVALIR
jgi:hypothetical protein